MKILFIVLIISCYILSQTIIHGRTTGLRKIYWSLPTNNNYQPFKYDPRRQAGKDFNILLLFFIISLNSGWGKRHDVLIEDDYNELPSNHPYSSHDNTIHNWFDDT